MPPSDKPKDDGGDKKITLYRRVHGKHPDLKNAKLGMAVPRGLVDGHGDPFEHNMGNNNSIFISWTTNKLVVIRFAGRRGYGGVVLTKKFKINLTIPSVDKHHQQELLVPGVVTGVKVERVRPKKKK